MGTNQRLNGRRIVFITGTDTGVGKTVLAASLVDHLRNNGVRALGMKPFCSGGRDDVRLLQSVQQGELSDDEVNPFYFAEAVAPVVALRKSRRNITLKQTLRAIADVQKRCEVLVIEGSGGVLVPLGQGFSVADVIRVLKCEVVIAARNRLGTINHTLLTAKAVRALRVTKTKVVLMDCGDRDDSTETNFEILSQSLEGTQVLRYPFLGINGRNLAGFRRCQKFLEKVLARLIE